MIKALMLALPGLLFSWLFYTRYWLWRDCIEAAQSSCITPDGDRISSGAFVWGLLAVPFYMASIIVFLRRGRPPQ